MPLPVSYSREYDRVRRKLTPGERLIVAEAEDQIAANPDPSLRGRFEDRGYCYDSRAEDFLIEYRLRDQEGASFERLIDLRHPDL